MNETNKNRGPAHRYEADLRAGLIKADAAQLVAVGKLQDRYLRLCAGRERQTLFARMLGRRRADTPKGLYFWGGVGRGKTYLMDLFFHALPGTRKLRMHFHRFMLMIHARLAEQKGRSDPLVHVAQKLASETDVICFDEFFVSDIGDAMILANLLQALFDAGVMLVTTSNIPPDRLYERGLQRQKFLPAIELLKRHTEVLRVDGGVDYRLQSLDKVPVYLYPLGAASERALEKLFAELTRGLHVESDRELEIVGRTLRARRWAEGVAWFDFAVLCRGARGAADYIELARQNHSVFISGLPRMGEDQDDELRRFITLVDEFYDRGVKLVLSAAGPLEELYAGRELSFAFSRTISRLQEMQTREYLAAEHRPD